MRKYFTLFRLGIAEAFSTRGNYVYWVLVDVISVGVMPFLWIAVVAARGEPIAGFGTAELVTYFLGSGIIWQVVVTYPFTRIIRDVQTGDLAHDLVRPYSYFWKLFALQLGFRVARLIFTAPFFIAVIVLFRRFILLPQSWTQVGMLLVSLLLAYGIIYVFNFLVGLAIFWFDEGEGIVDLSLLVLMLFCGDFAPLSFFPSWLFAIASALPFQYVLNFPLQIYLGHVALDVFIREMTIAFGWFLGLYLLYVVFWRRGVRLFSGVGR